jgi:uncharacterized protein (TIGR01777 family)
MQIAITGSSGLIGRQLVADLASAAHSVIHLVRRAPRQENERVWEPESIEYSPALLDGCDALIHLAGENIAGGRWNADRKRRIYESRVQSTRRFAELIRGMSSPPRVFVVASAIGYYGDRGEEILTESSPAGSGFLAEVCRDWEAAADPARNECRVVHVRTGIVLDAGGGALHSMLLPFKLGLGGVVGSGRQYWSWISLTDIARLFQFAVEDQILVGPVNGVSPRPATNREFTKALGKVLHRPTVFPLPAFAAKIVLGEMSQDLILASTRVLPEVAQSSGFHFQHPELIEALRSCGF